jgi:hypothetical protein
MDRPYSVTVAAQKYLQPKGVHSTIYTSLMRFSLARVFRPLPVMGSHSSVYNDNDDDALIPGSVTGTS